MLVNGKQMSFGRNITVSELLEELKLNHEKVVVELNLEIVSKDRFNEQIITDSDTVEIVAFVGGG